MATSPGAAITPGPARSGLCSTSGVASPVIDRRSAWLTDRPGRRGRRADAVVGAGHDRRPVGWRACLDKPEPCDKAASMRSRTDGMWWGTAIEAPDPGALARFYSELLGWPIGHEEPGTTILAAPQGSIYVVFQQATGYQAPVWPPVDGQQRPMMH